MVEIAVTVAQPVACACDALILAIPQDAEGLPGPVAALDRQLGGLIAELRASGEFKGEHNQVATLYGQGRLPARRVLLVGLGQRAALNGERLRKAAGTASRVLRNTAAEHAAWVLPPTAETGLSPAEAARAVVEGTLLGLYRFTSYLSEPPGPLPLQRLTLLAPDEAARGHAEQGAGLGQAMAAGVATARDLVNEPPNVLTPGELASRAAALASRQGLAFEALGPEEMTAAGMGALLGVAMGSAQPPCLIVLRYLPAANAPGDQISPIGLIGKGITFDTGGISLKPGADMHLMKGDMGGAAAVLGAMHTVSLLKPPRPVTAVIAAAENMPGSRAQRPGDVVRAMDGSTIEIQNTDAEGRLVLADALCYARQQGLAPLIDVATLTGAIVVALGPYYSGVFANDDALGGAVLRAAGQSGERMWRMPLDDDYNTLLKSDCADLRNVGGREGGSIIGAMFIGHFARETPWAHLDIAGLNYATTEAGYQPRGGTGVAARTLAQFVLDQATADQG